MDVWSLWCTAGIGLRSHSLPAVHRRPHFTNPGSRPQPTSVRRRYTHMVSVNRLRHALELQYTIASCIDDVASWMRSNRLQLNIAKSEILWSITGRRSHQLPHLFELAQCTALTKLRACRCCPWPRHLYRDDVSMRSQVAKTVSVCYAVLKRPQIRFPAAGNITCFVTTGLRKCNPRRYSAIPAQASPVGNELCCKCCPAGFPVVEVRPHHSAPSRTSLVEGGGEDWLQACPCLGIQVSAGSSTVISCWRTPWAGGFRSMALTTFCLLVIASHPSYAVINRRRPSFSGCCGPYLEQSTALRWHPRSQCQSPAIASRHISSGAASRDYVVVPEKWLSFSDTYFLLNKFTVGYIVQCSEHSGTKACPPTPRRFFLVPPGKEVGHGCAN